MQPNLIIMCGPQGSGKSTWAKKYVSENPNIIYLSTDDIWLSIGPITDQSIAQHVYPMLYRKAEIGIRKGQDVLLDATFVCKKWRKDAIKLGRRLGAWLVVHVFNAPRETLIKRIAERTKKGGMAISDLDLDRYIAMFEQPDNSEFDEIIIH